MSEIEIEPWVVITGQPPEESLALWRLESGGRQALTLFSSESLARNYSLQSVGQSSRVVRPDRHVLIKIMIECFERKIGWAVLDPDGQSARRIFDLRDVLKAARKELGDRT